MQASAGRLAKNIIATMGFKIKGLAAAPVVPLHENGEINVDIIGNYVDLLVKQGIKHVYVNGFTGEGPSLSLNERKLITEKWIEEGKSKLDKIIVQVGGTNLKDSQELAIHAKSMEASAIASLPPLFYKSDMFGLVEYFRELTSVVPDTPFIYYHIPAYSGVCIQVEQFLMAAKDKLPSLVGVKFSHNDLFDVTQCLLVENGKFQIMLGSDENLLSALAIGVTTAIGSTYNVCGKLSNSIIEAFKKGDLETARQSQYKTQEFVKILLKHGDIIATTKAALQLCGLQVGPPRLPMIALSEEKLAAFKKDLETAGLFDISELSK